MSWRSVRWGPLAGGTVSWRVVAYGESAERTHLTWIDDTSNEVTCGDGILTRSGCIANQWTQATPN